MTNLLFALYAVIVTNAPTVSWPRYDGAIIKYSKVESNNVFQAVMKDGTTNEVNMTTTTLGWIESTELVTATTNRTIKFNPGEWLFMSTNYVNGYRTNCVSGFTNGLHIPPAVRDK